jgi:hypothetical protein
MTDPVRPSGNFLERWSRKKIDAEREAPETPGAQEVTPPEEGALPERQAKADATVPAKAAPKPEFDLASLPSLDSITAATDIRAFLAPGVPKELARAALRRVWSADPAIRDFKGLAENDWDFTDPTAMPGFGALPPGYDVKKLVAQIFGGGEKPTDPEVAEGQPPIPQAPIAQQIAPPAAAAEPEPSSEAEAASGAAKISEGGQQVAHSDVVQRNNITASHNSNADDDTEEPKNRRQHGGALPQ